MKTICTLALCLFIGLVKAQLPSDSLIKFITFENLQAYKPGYGETLDDPLSSGAFKNLTDRSAMQTRMIKLRNSFRWPDGSTIDFSKRGSTMGKSGMVDQYMLENPATKETFTLVVDPYKEDSVYYVPKGLIALNKSILAKEIAPFLKKIEEINQAENPFEDQKQNMTNVTNYLASNIGVKPFTDGVNLLKIITDTQAKAELKSFLFAIYVLNKFYALGKNLPQPKAHAFNKMKAAFVNFQKSHPDVETGNIKINLN